MTTPSNTMLEDNLRSALASGERPKKANALSACSPSDGGRS